MRLKMFGRKEGVLFGAKKNSNASRIFRKKTTLSSLKLLRAIPTAILILLEMSLGTENNTNSTGVLFYALHVSQRSSKFCSLFLTYISPPRSNVYHHHGHLPLPVAQLSKLFGAVDVEFALYQENQKSRFLSLLAPGTSTVKTGRDCSSWNVLY